MWWRHGPATRFFNENDLFTSLWLRELFPGQVVDNRSIEDLVPADVLPFRRVHLFAGIGGWEEALRLAGWPEDRPVWTGSCPCQPFSDAGKRRGIDDERHLWPEMRRLIAECRPSTVFGEQVASQSGRHWLAGVRADLEALGHAVGCADLCDAGAGAPHIRQRLFWVAHADRHRRERCIESHEEFEEGESVGGRQVIKCCDPGGGMAHTHTNGRRSPGQRDGEVRRPEPECGGPAGFWSVSDLIYCRDGRDRRVEPGTFPLAHGVPARVGRGGHSGTPIDPQASHEARTMRLRGYGNAIVPQVAAIFIRSFMESIDADQG